MEDTINFLINNIDNNAQLVVATSGGPDSMCLLSLICSLKKEKNLEIICAHVNHKIRAESDEEAQMVEKYCQEKGIIFEKIELNEFQNGEFTEELARRKRYDFFKKLINKYQAKYLLTAHHGDDLIETILMRMTRGSTLSGYAGIRLVSENRDYKILRPLLYLSKDEIIEYVNICGVPYRVDKSNTSQDYTRNRYRKEILPFLKKEDIHIHKKYLKFSNELQDYEKFVNDYININGFIVDNSVVINKIKNESVLIKRKSIELLIKKIQAYDLLDVSDTNMNDIIKIMDNTNKSITLKNGYRAINSYGLLKIEKIDSNSFEEIILDKDVETDYFKFYYNSKEPDNTNNCICLLSNEVKLPLKLRSKIDGDKINVKNLNGSKKVKDIFIDSKVPKQKRENYPILVDASNTVLWIPGIKKSQFSKDKSEKYDIIIKCEAR